MGPDDQTLVAAAQSGDRTALDALLRRHYDRIHAICRRIAGSAQDADDAAQEAMISIVRGLPRFDGRAAFTTWLYRIATNAALDEVRRRGRRPGLHLAGSGERSEAAGSTVEPADPLAHRLVEGAADRLTLDEALAALPEEFRVAVVLRDVGDLDYGEIAEALDIPLGTVKSRIARGRGLLITALQDGSAAGNHRPGSGRPSPTDPAPDPDPTAP